jgi:hypothetical protein
MTEYMTGSDLSSGRSKEIKERLDAAISGTIPATPAIAGTEDPITLGGLSLWDELSGWLILPPLRVPVSMRWS